MSIANLFFLIINCPIIDIIFYIILIIITLFIIMCLWLLDGWIDDKLDKITLNRYIRSWSNRKYKNIEQLRKSEKDLKIFNNSQENTNFECEIYKKYNKIDE